MMVFPTDFGLSSYSFTFAYHSSSTASLGLRWPLAQEKESPEGCGGVGE